MSGMLDWAKREIEIACKKERGNAKKKTNLIMDVLVMKVR